MTVNVDTLAELAGQLSIQDQQVLLKRLRDQLLHTPPRKPRSLEGSWRGVFPEDFDIDAALKEIRSGWLEELDEFTP